MKVRNIENIVVGAPDIDIDAPSHIRGVGEGNRRRRRMRPQGYRLDEKNKIYCATARRSTGVNPGEHRPIDPRMPVLTPP
jgi:hypothetical protein